MSVFKAKDPLAWCILACGVIFSRLFLKASRARLNVPHDFQFPEDLISCYGIGGVLLSEVECGLLVPNDVPVSLQWLLHTAPTES